jgi:PPM family protein phosphatase
MSQSTDPRTETVQGRLEYASLSDVGLRRSNNQDSLALMPAGSPNLWQERGDLFVVADGMGAHAAGELASKLSTDTVPLVYHKLMDRTPAEAVLAAIEEANAQIHSRGQASAEFKGMGTTTTALVLLPYGALLAHVGDSRAYRLRGNRLEQLTFDHSLVWEMRESGQVPDFVPKNVITRSLGPSPKVQVDLEGPLPTASGDTFLMCSDGLSGQVKDEELGMILGSMPPAEAARSLVDLANLRGGPDNITVIIAKAVGPGWAPSSGEMPQPQAEVRPVSPLVWIAMGVTALLGLGLLVMAVQNPSAWIPAGVCLVAAAVLGIGAVMYRKGGEKKGPAMNPGAPGRYGRGPYTAVVCPPTPGFVKHLAETLRELREAASQADLEVDTAGLNAILDRAAAGNQAGDYSQAVRYYCQGISFLVAEFKRQGKSRPSGSRR